MDLTAEIQIAADPADIAAVMFDPARTPEWMSAVTRVEILDRALAPGARVRMVGAVLSREFTWTTEVATVHFPHLLALRMADGPVVGMTRFDVQRSGPGSRVRIRYAGELGPALAAVPEALVTGPLHAMLTADLDRLKRLVQGQA